MFLVGLTGGIATGKSTVASIFQEYGIKIIDSDIVARKVCDANLIITNILANYPGATHDAFIWKHCNLFKKFLKGRILQERKGWLLVVEPGTSAWKKIQKEFGNNIILPNGMIDRQELGKIIFSNSELRKKLNSITHPEIYKEIFWSCLKMFLQGHQFIIVELPLLYENGKMTKYIHKVIVVSCNENQQLRRLMMRNGFSEFDSLQRINAQMPLKDKCQMADFIIDNSGTYEETKQQVKEIVEKLKSCKYHWKIRFFVLSFVFTTLGLVGYIVYKMFLNFS